MPFVADLRMWKKAAVTLFTDDEVLIMAKQEHQRWMDEKIIISSMVNQHHDDDACMLTRLICEFSNLPIYPKSTATMSARSTLGTKPRLFFGINGKMHVVISFFIIFASLLFIRRIFYLTP